MRQTKSPAYTECGIFEAHSVLTFNLITIGNVVQCSKGFLPQVKNCGHWINISSSLESLEAARNFLFDNHYQFAQKKRGWTDAELAEAVNKAKQKDLEMWSARLANRVELQRDFEINLPLVKERLEAFLSHPELQQVNTKKLKAFVWENSELVHYSNRETSRVGQFRTLEALRKWCENTDAHEARLNEVAKLD